MSTNSAFVPPLKWAGGKRWLISRVEFSPPAYTRLVEPFLGSGAVFFHLRPSQSILSDLNQDLINFYLVMRDQPELLSRYLRDHAARHSKEYYYHIRNSKPRSRATAAARFLYLNRTCWNGLYRVNRDGQFNVPVGTKTAVRLPSDNFKEIAKLLQGAAIMSGDFSNAIELCGAGDFIFADPPYTLAHNFNGFVKYNESIFSWADQIRLRDALSAASQRGAKFVVTNASHASIRELYSGFDITPISRAGVIAGSSLARGRYEELLIRNYEARQHGSS